MKKKIVIITALLIGFLLTLQVEASTFKDECYAWCEENDPTDECYEYCDLADSGQLSTNDDETVTGTVTKKNDQYKLNTPIGTTEYVDNFPSYINIWLNFIVGAAGIMATAMIMYAGLKWLTSRGNSGVISDSKEKIISAVAGLVLAFLSYTILQLINPKLTTLGIPDLGDVTPENNYSEDNIPASGVVPVKETDARSENEVRKKFNDLGIKINAEPPKTQVGGLTQTAVDQISFMAADYKDKGFTDEFVITAGSEKAGHTGGSHPAGQAIDLRTNSDTDSYILENMVSFNDYVGETAEGYYIYKNRDYNGGTIRVIDERKREGAPHWHIEFY